jgi:fructose-bisphosphate aldolase class II
MTLVSGISWLRQAQADAFALGAFNANTLEQMQAITQAAQAERAPVVIQVSRNAVQYMGAGSHVAGLHYAAGLARVAAGTVDVPVVLHLDHGGAEDILQALSLGFTSVMFDGSHLPFEENVSQTRALCTAAHAAGACFESELGEVPRAGVPGMERGEPTDPGLVAEYVARTGIDALAVSIGSVHALKQKEVRLDLDRLDAIRAVVDLPLVLHGASGVLDESIAEGIRRGLCKVNVATQLNGVFTRAIREYLVAFPDDVDPRKYLEPARQLMMEQVRERMRFFGVAGKAAG